MFLSDRTIRTLIASGAIGINPFDETMIQPCSIDLKLGDIDIDRPIQLDATIWSIQPGQFVLASTVEYVQLPAHVAATVSGKSTWGRKGLAVHITAGHIDPGFQGQITLEMFNHSQTPIVLRKGTAIAQLVFTYLDVACDKPYAGRYQAQTGPTKARPSLKADHEYLVHKSMCDYPERACICK